MSKITMYRGIDKLDGEETMFAVRGDEVLKSFYSGDDDPWNTAEGFGYFDSWGNASPFPLSDKMHDHVTKMDIVWEE